MPLFGLFKKTEKAVEKTRAGWFDRVARLFERPSVDATTWEDLEELLILADVGAETAEKLINRVRERAKGEGLSNPASVRAALQEEMVRMLSVAPPARPDSLGTGSPLVVIVAGVNGSGKTTSIAKLANYYKSEGKNVLLVAADTFRAAAIEQLQAWAERVGVDIIAGKQGSDPGAVVYDALQAARSRKSDAVIIDTAGRLHTKFNLMEELKKIKRIAARESGGSVEVLLVLDATTGQNGLAQARYFQEAVALSGILLSKLDGTAKGGIVLAICDQLQLPLLFIGTGEALDDIAPFDPDAFVAALFAQEAPAA